jgi:hypothetical protein
MDRRRAARRVLAPDEPLAHAKLRIGGGLVVLDASSWGALAETTQRLLPGRHLDVHVVTSGGRVLVRVRVARAFVWHLLPDAIYYRVALAFEQPIDARMCRPSMPPGLVSLPTPEITPLADRAADGDITFTEPLSA